MNIKTLNYIIKERKINKATLIKLTNISRPALDAILSGKDFKVSNLEKICAALQIPVGVLFEPDDKDGVKTSGDFSPASYSGNVSVFAGGDALLAEKVSSLQAQVDALRDSLADKDRIIRLLDR